MSPSPRPAAAGRCVLWGLVWAVLATEVLAAKSEEPAASGKDKLPDQSAGPDKQPKEAPSAQTKVADDLALSKLKEELAASKAEVGEGKAAHEAENKKLAEKLKNHEGTISHLNDQMDNDVATLTEKVASKDAEILDLTSKWKAATALTAEVASKGAEILDLTTKLKAASEASNKLSVEVDKQTSIITSLRTDVKSKTDFVAQLEEEKQKRDMTIKTLRIEIADHLQTINAKSAEIGAITAQVDTHKKAVEDGTKTISELRSGLTEKTDAHAKLKKEDMDLRKDHMKLHDQHELLQAQYADPSVQHFLRAKAIKVYKDPGVEGAANKTFTYVLPSLKTRYAKGKQSVKAAETALYSKLNAFVGSEKTEPWLPAISGCLVYGAIIVPFICTVCCLTRIVCKLRPLLLFCHMDFLITTFCAGIFAMYTKKEPLAAFAHHDASVYLFTQVIFGLAYLFYLVMLCCAYCRARAGTSEGMYRLMQIIGAAPIAVIYYLCVWTPAMLDQMPRMDELVASAVGHGQNVTHFVWLPYLPTSVVFLILLRLERLSWHASGDLKAGQEKDQISVVMRNDVELARLYGEASTGDGAPEAKKE